jgi:hypothetical protein
MLYVCSSCARHVRASDAACPFCGTKAHQTTTRVVMPGRLARSALVALAATACGPHCPPQGAGGGGSPRSQVIQLEDGGIQVVEMPIAIYGTSPPPLCH